MIPPDSDEPPPHVLPLIATFDQDIREHILAHLPREPEHTAELEGKSVRDLLDIYANWQQRLVFPRPRCVHRSKTLTANPLASHRDHQPGLEALITKIEKGDVITPHLSRGIVHGYRPAEANAPKALLKRRDLDLLLNDWCIHHLHITTKLDPDGFVERKSTKPPKPLLFAAFQRDHAYLIDLMHHGDWEHEHLVEVVAREWPDAGLVMELKSILPGEPFARDARRNLRNVGMPTHLNVDGRTIAGRGCLTMAGTSAMAQHGVRRLAWRLSDFLHRVAEKPDHVADILQQRGQPVPEKLDLHFEFFGTGGYGIVDTQAGEIVRLG